MLVGSVTNHVPSAKAMRRHSITACRYSALLWSRSVKVRMVPAFSSSSRRPSAMRATMPCPLGGCSHISIPWVGADWLGWPSRPWEVTEPIFWPLKRREMGAVDSEPVSAWWARSERVR